MSHTMTALAAALPLTAGWSVHSLWMRRRIEAARRDPLTGLLTRDAFTERAGRAVARGQSAVYMIDLDGFKQVNDTHGHAAGDAVLTATAERLRSWGLINNRIVARFGGDEFAAATKVRDRAELERLTDDLARSLTRPVPFEGGSLAVGASVGAVAVYANEGPELTALLRRADEAMYTAKRNGGGCSLTEHLSPIRATVNGRRAGRRGTHHTTGPEGSMP
ncbi:GGDEF domain-containing protein [Streptomyces sp. NPDC003016]